MKRIVNLGIRLLMTTSLLFIVVLAFFFLCLNKNFILDKMDSYNYYDAIIDGYQSKISDKINDDKVLDVVINLFDRDMVKEDISLVLDNYIYGLDKKINHNDEIKSKLSMIKKDKLNNYTSLINSTYRESLSMGNEYKLLSFHLSMGEFILIMFSDALLFLFLLFVSYKINHDFYNLYVSLMSDVLLISFLCVLLGLVINYNFVIRSWYYTLFVKYIIRYIIYYNLIFSTLFFITFIIGKKFVKI